jgi:trans-2,3-dihydro-3-hydroxyanthranilate isomerase
MDEAIDDVWLANVLTNKDESKRHEWLAILLENELQTVAELQLLRAEEWQELALPLGIKAAIKRQLEALAQPISSGGLSYELLDVFTETPFGGNPLAVVFGAEGLSDESLRNIAKEFNLSETTFVLPPADSANTARIRIFTSTGAELPFAGHPNVGTGCALAKRAVLFGKPVGTSLVFEEIGGLVPVTILPCGAAQMEAPMPFTVSSIGEGVAPDLAAMCLGLTIADMQLHTEGRVAGLGGNSYTLIQVANRSALERCVPDYECICCHSPPKKVLAWCGDAEDEGVDLRCRMFTALGAFEDAATGAANCCLLALLATIDSSGDSYRASTLSRRIVQCVEMGRPSLLIGECDRKGRYPRAVRVAGASTAIMSGQIRREHLQAQ